MLDDGRNISTAPIRYVLHSLKESSVYFVRLAAYNEAGLSNYSEPVEFTTISAGITRSTVLFEFMLRILFRENLFCAWNTISLGFIQFQTCARLIIC